MSEKLGIIPGISGYLAGMKQVFSDDTSIHLKFIECGMKFW